MKGLRLGAIRAACAGAIAVALTLAPQSASGETAARVTSVDKVAEGIWMATTDKGSNASWFLLGDKVIAIDSGSDPDTGKAILAKIQETAGKPVGYVIITHAHGDHAGGVPAFVDAGAQVVCQDNAAAGLIGMVAKSSRPRAGVLALSERLDLVGSGRRVVIDYLGRAHTNGDLIVYLPDDKILFSGDIALVGRAPYMQSPDVDPDGWENVLERLTRVDAEKVVPGHGAVGARQAVSDTLAYVKKVNELAKTMIQEKVSEDLIEARLRRMDLGVEGAAITPELVSNIRSVMRFETAKAATSPTPAAKKEPAKKKS